MPANQWRYEGTLRRGLRGVGDALAAAAALASALWLRIHFTFPGTTGLLPPERLALLNREWAVFVLAQLITIYLFALYDRPPRRRWPELLARLSTVVTLQGFVLIGYLFVADRTFPRSVLLLYVGLDLALLAGWRLLIDRGPQHGERRVAIVGSGHAAGEIARALEAHRSHGLRVAGHVPLPGEGNAGAALEPALGPRLGSTDDLPALLASKQIDDIILAASGESWQTRLIDQLAGSRPDHTNVLLLPGPFESLIGRMRYRWVHDLPLIEVVRESEWRINWPAKRVLDLVFGGLLAVASTPLMLLIALAVRLTSNGPVLYRQERVGKGQRPITLIKFRTMRDNAEADSGEVLAQPGDPRLTPIGALLRSLRLDEFPQLLNVLEGTMSLVGPRPERPGFVARYLREVPGYAERFSLAPGLTGLAQINGEYHSSAENKLRYDLAYAANWSFWLDLSILLRTVKIVLTSRGV